jgi:hypothetical protein
MTLTAERVRSLLDYSPPTGLFIWRPRPVAEFTTGKQTALHLSRRWNTRYAGTIAGTTRHDGYVTIRIDDKPFLAHRLAWLWVLGCWPEAVIDHIDGNPNNNRIANLREATHRQNQQAQKRRPQNTSGFKGVSRRHGRWAAQIRIDGRKTGLGLFDTKTEAHHAYLKAARQHFGEFAKGE